MPSGLGLLFTAWRFGPALTLFGAVTIAAILYLVLPFHQPAARILATYRVPEHAPLDNALIAAIAQAADMTVATRNTRYFQPLGVACLSPWDQKPYERIRDTARVRRVRRDPLAAAWGI